MERIATFQYNMERIATFKKVSFGEFKKDWLKTFPEWKDETDEDYMDKVIWNVWVNLKLPKRSTKGSAGYDFYMPCDLLIPFNESRIIPTGIRCQMRNDYVLSIYPRSGLGFKTGMHLSNSVAIVDSDYFASDNEGHIFIKIVNDSSVAQEKPLQLKEGQAFCQGIFTQYGITNDDNIDTERNGGLGSTDK